MKKGGMSLEDSSGKCTGGLERGKGKGKLFNYIIVSKIKEIIF